MTKREIPKKKFPIRITDPNECVNCGICKANCSFLTKYDIDFSDVEKMKDLAYHCFLCGKCTEVCPIGIDGRQIILDYRREKVAENKGRVPNNNYKPLIFEKKEYKFKNYKSKKSKTVLFPGCNFPSIYPKTTKYLAELLDEYCGATIAFDCCGKPISELGLIDDEKKITQSINDNLKAMGAEEVVMLCPNCYDFLGRGKRLDIEVISVYDKLRELGLGNKIKGKSKIFPPCPDREPGELLSQIIPFFEEEPEVITSSQCCGLGGCAGAKEPDLANNMLNIPKDEHFYTYCGSCSGNFIRKGYHEAEHVLLKILGSDEGADVKKSLLNRMMFKYYRMKDKNRV